MYRILKLKNVTFCELRSARLSCGDVFSSRSCTLCSRNPTLKTRPACVEYVRHQSSGLHTALRNVTIRKKRSRKTKENISELLSVDFYSASEAKAKITRLNASDLSKLMQNPDLGLQELHKLRKKAPKKSHPQSLPGTQQYSTHERKEPEAERGITLVFPPSGGNNSPRRDPFYFSRGAPNTSFYSNSILSTSLVQSSSYPTPCVDYVDDIPFPTTFPGAEPDEFLSNEEISELDEFDRANNVAGVAPESDVFSHATESAVAEEAEDIEEEIGAKAQEGTRVNVRQAADWKKWLDKYEMMRDKNRMNMIAEHHRTYLDVCVNTGMMKQAYSSLQSYCSAESRKKNRLATDVNLFEIVMRGAAFKADLVTIQSLLHMMKEYKIPLSLPCYAACLECLGRLPASDESKEMITSLLEDMEVHKYSLDDIFSNCYFFGTQRKMVLNAIRMLKPEYVFKEPNKDSSYKVGLLSALNDTSTGKAEKYKSPAEGLFTKAEIRALADEQISNDIAGYVKVRNVSCLTNTSDEIKQKRLKENVEKQWRESIKAGLVRDLKLLKTLTSRKNQRLYAYLTCLPMQDLVELILLEVQLRIGESDMYSPCMMVLCSSLGFKLKRQYELRIMKTSQMHDVSSEVYKEYCERYLDPDSYPPGPSKPREIWDSVQVGKDVDFERKATYWSFPTVVDIGKFLYTVILRDVKIDVNSGNRRRGEHTVPAFYTIFRRVNMSHQEQLKMHPAMYKIYNPDAQPYLIMDTLQVPMVSPSKPWTSTTSGGFPTLMPILLRLPIGPSRNMRTALINKLNNVPTQQVYPVLDALNQLGSIPWKVNSPVLDVVTEVFNTGGSLPLSIPNPPSTEYPLPDLPDNASKEERTKYFVERNAIRQQKSEMYSLWCDALFKICLGHHLRNRVFWLPHNMDFRGRVYPIAPHLQHMGCDMARSLLVFAKGEKLGPNGLDWLKIHTINLTGLKKRDSLTERLQFANEILPKIIDSADNPLNGEKWWMDSDEPWQTLAACMEIAAAVRSENPEEFVSHFPVHQDGSCNGLQHYAALGRDVKGAASVNLVASERPADVYSRISDAVEEARATAAKSGDPLAKLLEGYVRRKVVKQTVMTTVYGVTRYGAHLQIARQLEDAGFPKQTVKEASIYLASLTFGCLGEIFSSANKIQNWFTECAGAIGKSAVEPVEWVTPLGLPVIQPYFKTLKVQEMKSKVKTRPLESLSKTVREVPNVMKQRNGFPPNFIHSLDSCHMMLTSLFCEQEHITYVSVHDCFWVHPCNVDRLNKICRNQFVALHSEPILENLSKFLVDTYCADKSVMAEGTSAGIETRRLKRVLESVPARGEFDLKEVLDSIYFFS